MTQRTRTIIVGVCMGLCILCVVTFVVQHFMTPPRPSWHADLPWLALTFVSAAEIARWLRRRAIRNAD